MKNLLPNQSWDPPSYRYPSPLHSLKLTAKALEINGWKMTFLLRWPLFIGELLVFMEATGAQWTNLHHFSGMVQIPNLHPHIFGGSFAAAFFEGFARFNQALLRHAYFPPLKKSQPYPLLPILAGFFQDPNFLNAKSHHRSPSHKKTERFPPKTKKVIGPGFFFGVKISLA